MENTKAFLTRIIENVLVSKEDVRKEWNNIKSERLKLVKRLNKANQAIKFGVSKKKFTKRQIKVNNQEIERLRGTMLADCLSEKPRTICLYNFEKTKTKT